VSLKHQDAGKSAHPINVGEARWSSGRRGHGSPREFGIGSIRQRSESVDRNSSNRKTRCLRRANGLSDASRTCKRRLGSIRDGVHAVLSMCVEGKEPGDQVFTREDGKLIGDCRKTGTRCAAMLASAGWRVASVIELSRETIVSAAVAACTTSAS